MAKPTTQQRTVFWIVSIALIITLGYIVFLLTSSGSPLRSEASGPEILSSTQEPFLIRNGVVTSVNDSGFTVEEETGSFSVNFDGTVVRVPNAEGLFEIAEQSQVSNGDEVIVRYKEGEAGLTLESIDIVSNN